MNKPYRLVLDELRAKRKQMMIELGEIEGVIEVMEAFFSSGAKLTRSSSYSDVAVELIRRNGGKSVLTTEVALVASKLRGKEVKPSSVYTTLNESPRLKCLGGKPSRWEVR